MQQGIGCIIIAAHVGTMHHFGDFPIHAPGHDAQFFPTLALLFRNTAYKGYSVTFGAKALLKLQGKVFGNIKKFTPFGGNAQLLGNPQHFLLIFYMIILCLTVSHSVKSLDTIPAMVRVPGSATCQKPAKVAGNNDISISAANSKRRFFADPARTHGADTATDTALAETAMGSLLCKPVPGCFHPVTFCLAQHLTCIFPYTLFLNGFYMFGHAVLPTFLTSITAPVFHCISPAYFLLSAG